MTNFAFQAVTPGRSAFLRCGFFLLRHCG
jgi:hypothetical protein